MSSTQTTAGSSGHGAQGSWRAAQGKIRQPIVTVAGHVDHGKTSLLDRIRGTSVAKKEAGSITQRISCTILPAEQIEKLASSLLKKFNIQLGIPGFLLIDTPGHAAFTNLRRRGGSLADLVILVIDIRDGIMEQTVECIDILKQEKTPFVVALNKIDALSGWQQRAPSLSENIKAQPEYVRKQFDEKLYAIVGRLGEMGFDSDLFERVGDFTRQVPLVPISAKTGEGVPELLVMLAGLSQKFLGKDLLLKERRARGTVLEVVKDKGMTFLETVIYEGIIAQNSTVVVGSFDEPIVSKVRTLFEAQPFGKSFKPVKEASAATFLRMQIPSDQEILPGMPVIGTDSEKEVEEAKKELKKEVEEAIKLDKEGLVLKADSLGSLEALLFQLKKEGHHVSRAGVGNISKADLAHATSMQPIDQVILGFNVALEEKEMQYQEKVKVLLSPIIYKLMEELGAWKEEKEKELLKDRLDVPMPCKLRILPYVFRQRKPAVFGVRIEAGKLKPGMELISQDGEKVDEVKGIQHESKNINIAERGKEVAISMPKVTFGRQVKEGDILFSVLHEKEYKKLEENKKYLSGDEISVLKEILEIMRKQNKFWGI